MPNITKKQIKDLMVAENYFWNNSDWEENKATEKALYKLWKVVDDLLIKTRETNERSKLEMRKMRKKDPQYCRIKKGEIERRNAKE